MTNEFEDKEKVEESVEEVHQEKPSLIVAGNKGEIYNYHDAPDGIKPPERIDLNERELTINEAKIILPPADIKWELTKTSKKPFKACKFTLYYDVDGQQENYSGVRVFKVEKDDGSEGYGHPTIYKEGTSQARDLMKAYADFKEKDIEEVSLKEFMCFLNSKPKVLIATKSYTNPEDNSKILKNIAAKFI